MSSDRFKKVSGSRKSIALGEGKNQVPEFTGLLLAIEENRTHPGSLVYVMGTETEVVSVFGNAVLTDKVKEVGALYKIEYKGKAKGKNYKLFDVWTVDATTVKEDGLDKQYKSLDGDEPGVVESAGTLNVGEPEPEDDDLPF